jgi:hypothetical protein
MPMDEHRILDNLTKLAEKDALKVGVSFQHIRLRRSFVVPRMRDSSG